MANDENIYKVMYWPSSQIQNVVTRSLEPDWCVMYINEMFVTNKSYNMWGYLDLPCNILYAMSHFKIIDYILCTSVFHQFPDCV